MPEGMLFENRYPFPHQVLGGLFPGSCSKRPALTVLIGLLLPPRTLDVFDGLELYKLVQVIWT